MALNNFTFMKWVLYIQEFGSPIPTDHSKLVIEKCYLEYLKDFTVVRAFDIQPCIIETVN